MYVVCTSQFNNINCDMRAMAILNGRVGGIEAMKNLNHSWYISCVIHPLSLVMNTVPGAAPTLIHSGTALFLGYNINGGIAWPLADTHTIIVCFAFLSTCNGINMFPS